MIPRRTGIPFPERRFVPGGVRPELPQLEGDAAWDYGIDLFNAGYYWEAHEVLEGLWRAAPAGSVERVVTKALIQVAAARFKLERGNPQAARRIAGRAAAALEALGAARCRDLDASVLRARARRIADGDAAAFVIE